MRLNKLELKKHSLNTISIVKLWELSNTFINIKAYKGYSLPTIIEDLIKHDVNYNWAVEKYQVSYHQVYGWSPVNKIDNLNWDFMRQNLKIVFELGRLQ